MAAARLGFVSAFLLWLLHSGLWHGRADCQKLEISPRLFTGGDIIIGGLSPVHFAPTEAQEQANPDSQLCQGSFNTRGFEAVEAMLFAMDMLNEGHLKNKVLPNITIGMDIKDTCTSADYAVRESLNFTFIRRANLQDECSGLRKTKPEKHTVAVVGAAYSGVSMAVTNLCGLFYVPVVSYASTSRLLSNKVRFRYFLRTVPSDMLQARVMADLVRSMNWNYVIALASDTEYGRSGIEAFKEAVASFRNEYDICIPVDEKFTKRSSPSKFKEIFNAMKSNPKARVVILYAELHDADVLFEKFLHTKGLENYIFIGSDAWADSEMVLKSREHILDGMFGVVPEVLQVKKFNEYFVDFTERRRRRNPWMREYEQTKVAHNPAFFRQIFRHYSKAHYVMDAVLAIAYSLHDMLGCKPYKDCQPLFQAFNRQNLKPFENLLDYIKKVRFPGMSRDFVSFDDKGDPIGVYDIKRLLFDGENYKFVVAGSWGKENIGANGSPNKFLALNTNYTTRMQDLNHRETFSRCSKPCMPGYHKSPLKNRPKCCWECKKCSGSMVSNQTDMDECYRCPGGYWGNEDNSKCEIITPTYLRWRDALGIAIACISGAGLLSVIAIFLVFYIYSETPVVRASGRDLCYILLVGVAWCYTNPLFFIAEPTDIVCKAIPFTSGMCFSLVAGTLLTKTNRISRIFNRKLMKTGTPSFLSNKWQLLMILCLCLVECIICAVMVFFTKTGSTLTISDSKREVIKHCIDLPETGLAVWWVYNAGLVLVCTYQAFLTRKLPENYNEAKFITFTMLTTCIAVTVYIPTYIGTSNIYRTTITCFVFIIGATATVTCMFVPKVYVVLFRPEKNVPMQPRNQSIRLGTISPSTSFVRRLSLVPNDTEVEEENIKRRQSRIYSLPIIDGRAACKKVQRSTSLSPEMLLSGHTTSSPSDTRVRKKSVTYQFKFESIEEVAEHVSTPVVDECQAAFPKELLENSTITSGLYQRRMRRRRETVLTCAPPVNNWDPCENTYNSYEENQHSKTDHHLCFNHHPKNEHHHQGTDIKRDSEEDVDNDDDDIDRESALETDKMLSCEKLHVMKNLSTASHESTASDTEEHPVSFAQFTTCTSNVGSHDYDSIAQEEKDTSRKNKSRKMNEGKSSCDIYTVKGPLEKEKKQGRFDCDSCYDSLASSKDLDTVVAADESLDNNEGGNSEQMLPYNKSCIASDLVVGSSKAELCENRPMLEQREELPGLHCCGKIAADENNCNNVRMRSGENGFGNYLRPLGLRGRSVSTRSAYLESERRQLQNVLHFDGMRPRAATESRCCTCGQSNNNSPLCASTTGAVRTSFPFVCQTSPRIVHEISPDPLTTRSFAEEGAYSMKSTRVFDEHKQNDMNHPQLYREVNRNFIPCHYLHAPPISMSISIPLVTPFSPAPFARNEAQNTAGCDGVKRTNSLSGIPRRAEGTAPASNLGRGFRWNNDMPRSSISSCELHRCRQCQYLGQPIHPGHFQCTEQSQHPGQSQYPGHIQHPGQFQHLGCVGDTGQCLVDRSAPLCRPEDDLECDFSGRIPPSAEGRERESMI